ncbi:MAG: S9 family peptidase [Bacteroidota bacterium]
MTVNQFIKSVFTITICLLNISNIIQAQETPNPNDLIAFENPQAVEISANGNEVIIRTQKANLEKNRYTQTFWKVTTGEKTSSKKLDIPGDARSIQWFPEGNKIAYLSRAKQRKQIWIKGVDSNSAKQFTSEQGGVRDFSISPGGEEIAFTTVDVRAMAKERKQGKPKKTGGVEIDMLTFSAFQINKNLQRRRSAPSLQLFVTNLDGGSKKLVSDSLHVKDFEWSPDGNKIALQVSDSPMHNTGISARGSNLAIYNQQKDQLDIVAEGNQNQTSFYEDVISYSSPFWSPSGDQLGFLRIDHSDRWGTTPEVGIYNLQNDTRELVTNAAEQDLYKPIFHWTTEDHILVENTLAARRGLFSIDVSESTLSPVKISKSFRSQFSFSSNGQQITWIRESVNQIPELYFSDDNLNTTQKLSSFNEDTKDLILPEITSLTWESDDGTEVQGWYIHPKKMDKQNPPPTITLLHGGPGLPVGNKFDPYLEQWPFPIQSLTAKGYAVFIPNYRYTNSFGKEFKSPEKPDNESIKDVITGINYLISQNLADKNNLGIIGHSHGAWLGPMVAAEKPIFKAASFAEGFGNYLSMYGHLNGARNKELHEHQIGSTPYENPKRYLELSPAFKNDLTTQIPTLLEFGQRSPVAKQGVEFAKAFWRHNTPHKLTIYPNEGHSIRSPKMKIDAMKRNIAWFEEWMPVD